MKRNVQAVIAVVVIAAVIIAIENPFRENNTGIIDGEDTGISVGDKAPDFILESQRDRTAIKLSEYQGKNVVLNFWATWCPFCVDEMPKFESEANKYGNLEVIGVNLQESDINKINKFSDDLGVTYTLLLDPNGDVRRAYNVFTQPVTYFIDENGVITDRKFGPLTDKEIEEKFAGLAG